MRTGAVDVFASHGVFDLVDENAVKGSEIRVAGITKGVDHSTPYEHSDPWISPTAGPVVDHRLIVLQTPCSQQVPSGLGDPGTLRSPLSYSGQ
jgi:hypothetical protein